jgi:ring-1,2-phenylacetyl-CoA epoxidase subunit PaaD
VVTTTPSTLERAWAVAAAVTDPELPMLTVADLGVLRDVDLDDRGGLVVWITPTYSACPAMATMSRDLVRRLAEAGFPDATVRIRLSPPWTSDWISEHGRRALAEHGISPPGQARRTPTPLLLSRSRRTLTCPRCGSGETELISEFGSTACTAIYRCTSCQEPFGHVKEI